MSTEDKYREVVRLVRSWGRIIEEMDGCYGGGNGSSWHEGEPIGGTNHHFVINDYLPAPGDSAEVLADKAAKREAARLQALAMLKDGYGDLAGAGRVVNWFVGAGGVGTLIGTEPCNHAGKGDSTVVDRVKADLPPNAPHPPNNDANGNQWFSGKETQHMGNGDPYADALIDTLVDIDAAECIVFGWTANRQLMHYTWTNRKIDMSWMGGPDTGAGQIELVRRIQARIDWYRAGGTTTPSKPTTPDDGDDEVTKEQYEALDAKLDKLLGLVQEVPQINRVLRGQPSAPGRPAYLGVSQRVDIIRKAVATTDQRVDIANDQLDNLIKADQ